MKIIKCGGNCLKKYEDRLKIYQYIKEIDEKIILVVSAFNDSPYSTSSLRSLLSGNYSYYMQEELLVCGEIISSIKVCNELLNNYVDADLIFKEEIGIHVTTSNKTDEITLLDNSKISEKLDKHKVLVIPGFIGINQENRIVSLNSNGSDLTAILLAKMFSINEVYLFKDVLGLSSIDPRINDSFKLYKNVSFELMHQIIIHGSNLIQEKAIEIAKDNNININITHYLNHNYQTTISKFSSEKVIVFQCLDNNIYIDGYSNKEAIENILILKNIKYDYILPCSSYLKIVSNNNNTSQILNLLHQLYLKGEL